MDADEVLGVKDAVLVLVVMLTIGTDSHTSKVKNPVDHVLGQQCR